MNPIKVATLGVIGAAFLAPALAMGATVLDTGTPTGAGFPATLDSASYVAAEFSLSNASAIDGVNAYIASSYDTPGVSTFTVVLYGADGAGGAPGTQLYSQQGVFNPDSNGWSAVSISGWDNGGAGLSAGLYWIALEVGTGVTDGTSFQLPTPAPNNGASPAAAFAYNSNNGSYSTTGAQAFGVQVSAVPLPAAAWLLASGLLGVGGMARRRRVAA